MISDNLEMGDAGSEVRTVSWTTVTLSSHMCMKQLSNNSQSESCSS